MPTATRTDLAAGLDRHEQRRRAGLPTVSALAGPIGLGLQELRHWTESRSRTLATANDPRPDALAASWVDRLAEARDLAHDARAWLARRSGESAARVERMTPFELGMFLDRALPLATVRDDEAVGRWLLERAARGESLARPGLVPELAEVLARHDPHRATERVVAALQALIPEDEGPVLILMLTCREDRPETAWIETAARSLAGLAEVQPRLTLALALPTDALDAYEREAPDSRARVLIHEGRLHVPSLDGAEVGQRLAETPPELARSVERLVADGASDELVELFQEAARATEQPEPDDRARSEAERFLFERLESLPGTAGLFELNGTLDVRFGPSRPLEVDLLARALRLAIEIDGHYHFQDLDAYRRDRRKDFELQRQGFLVLRFLADDVVERLEEILDTIMTATALRDGHAQPGGRDNDVNSV